MMVKLERRRRRPGRISIMEERELIAAHDRLEKFTATVAAIIQVASSMRNSVHQIRIEDVERLVEHRAN
jgi:hypothetical protein